MVGEAGRSSEGDLTMEWMIIGVAIYVALRMVGGWGCGWRGYRGDLPGRIQDRIARRAERRARRWARSAERWGHVGGGDDQRRAALESAADRLDAASARLRARAKSGTSGELERGADGAAAASGARALEGRSGANGNGVGPSRRAEPVRRKETPLEELQRRFADGRISMEEYERELDELLGLGA